MKKVLIIEDEKLSANRLKKLLFNIDDTMQIDGPLRSVQQVQEILNLHNDYDIIFSDIKLPDGDIFEAFNNITPSSVVIFTTAYDKYSIQAIQCNGLAYLMKPIDEDELQNAINRITNLTEAIATHQLKLKNIMKDLMHYRERFLAYKQDELIPIFADDVLYFYKNDRNVLLKTEKGNVYSLPGNMCELEEQLDPQKFFRINRQYIANIRGIWKISQFFNSKLIVKLFQCEDANIIVSKERATMLKKWLNK